MTISKTSILVSAKWLRQQIMPTAHKLTSQLRVLDTSWVQTPDVDNYSFYKEGHIPTSVHFDLKKISPAKEGTFHKFSIPEPEEFKDYVEDLGISNHTHVVLYDRMEHRPSFRSWFLFRLFGHDKISVLNGGLYQWLVNGFTVTIEEPRIEPGEFEPKFQRHLIRDFDAMCDNARTGTAQVVDSRGAAKFAGSEDDPSSGHMPNSFNIPFELLLNEDKTFKSPEELKKLFDHVGVDLTKPIVGSCLTATTACSVVAAAFMLGKEDVPVYNGSFTEWSKRADPQDILKLKNEE